MTSTNGHTATTDRFRSFEAAVQEGEPIGFALGGETFDCVPIIPAGAMAYAFGLSGRKAYLVQCIEWVESVLVDDSHPPVAGRPPSHSQIERFREVINRKDPVVSAETLGETVSWLIEQYTARPTQPPAA